MATIESKRVVLNTSPDEVYSYVQDLNNLIELLPKDNVSDWQGAETSCSFKVSGGYKIGLAHKSLTSPNHIVLESTEGSALKFDLDIRFNEQEGSTEAGLTANLDINPFMKMMVEKPLKNLFDYIATKLESRFNG
jgi:carbon monoxide dehydrogenase subunit G